MSTTQACWVCHRPIHRLEKRLHHRNGVLHRTCWRTAYMPPLPRETLSQTYARLLDQQREMEKDPEVQEHKKAWEAEQPQAQAPADPEGPVGHGGAAP